MKFGAPSEFQTRQTGLVGLKEKYGLDIAPDNFVAISDGGGPATVRALIDGTVTAANIFSTSPAIEQNNLVVLEDPKNNFLAANVVPLVASQKMSDELKTVLDAVQRQADHRGADRTEHLGVGQPGCRPRRGGREVDHATTASTSRSGNSGMITFENVTKRYPDGTVAVDDLTLEVPEGTLTVFVGPSGCGKTTSMRMINRMIDPTSGTIPSTARTSPRSTRCKLRLGIGYVIQSAGLMPHLRVSRQRRDGAGAAGESRRSARKSAIGVLERVGLDPKLADRYPGAALRRAAAARRGGPGAWPPTRRSC